MRVFVGINLDIKTKEKLYDLQRVWLSYAINKRPVRYDNFHITIRFVGEMEEKEIETLYYLLKDELFNTKTFLLRINDIGSFVKYDKELIWAGITTGKDKLRSLNNILNKTLITMGHEHDKRKYRPHITLARDVTFTGKVSGLPIVDVTEEINEVIIFRSHYINGELTYTPLYKIPLRKEKNEE